MKRRVVITGIGVVTPIGKTVEDMWEGVARGGVWHWPDHPFDAANFPTKIAPKSKGSTSVANVDDPARYSHAGRNIHFAIGAGVQAVKDAGISDTTVDPPRFGVVPGRGRRPAGFSPVHEADLRSARRKTANSIWRSSPGPDFGNSTRSANSSKKPKCPPGIWRRCSTRKVRI